MTLEIIATNLTDAKKAEEYGADRLELSPSMKELGITPSYGLIDSVVREVNIPFNVIIRPHSQSFVYNADDIKVMIRDIQMAKSLGAHGIVIGALTENNVVDEEVIKHLLQEAEGLDITFHKAFDFVRNLEEAFETLSKYSRITRILTSGGPNPAPESPEVINKLIRHAQSTHLQIMVGGGLRSDNFQQFYEKVKPREVHFGSGARIEESYSKGIDKSKIDHIKAIMT